MDTLQSQSSFLSSHFSSCRFSLEHLEYGVLPVGTYPGILGRYGYNTARYIRNTDTVTGWQPGTAQFGTRFSVAVARRTKIG